MRIWPTRTYVVGGELCHFTMRGARVVMTWNKGNDFLHFPDGMETGPAVMAVIKHGGPTAFAASLLEEHNV